MKQIGFKIICLIILACITVVSGFSEEKAINYETRILETFNGDADSPIIWKTQASRFITKVDIQGNVVDPPLPRQSYVEAWPIAAFGNNRHPGAETLRSLGVQASFDRRGYNWIDIYPVLADDPDENPYEIQIPGRVHNIDVWVWGANLNFYVEVFLRDHRGVIHTLRLGDIGFIGWKNLRVAVPTSIPQARRVIPSYAGLKFVKFRLWTIPTERVDGFYVYFKQLKVLTDTFENLFDGNDLADPENVNRLWTSN
ncbi:MAG: flagellar filament outer layer protein FlaA [Treponema sp.]|jgi:hypothetical protein|nr:flagellar filament outer layer protein FlaA [Treponema sp.]